MKRTFLMVLMAVCAMITVSAVNPTQPQRRHTTQKSTTPTPEVLPSYPGGASALYSFLYKNIKYPPSAKKKGVKASVVARFMVKADGSIEDIRIVRHGTKDMDDEVVRVVKMMPKMTPAKYHGKAVDCEMHLPVMFRYK